MVGKSCLSLALALSILLFIQPCAICTATTRAFEKYDMDKLPPQDMNGNFTLDEDDEWDITGQGILEGNITMQDESIMIISNANITVNGTIWAKDSSEIIIRSSILRLEIPSPEPVVVEKQYDNPNGFVLIEDGVTLTIEDSSVYLYRHDIDQTTPDGMMIPVEVLVNFGKFVLDSSYLNTRGIISFDTFNVSVTRGIVMHMNCEIDIIDSNLTSGIVFYVNSHGSIHNSNFRSISMQKNTKESDVIISNSILSHTVTIDVVSKVFFQNCELKSCLIVADRSEVFLRNTTLMGLKLQGNATAIMDNSRLSVGPPYPDWDHAWDNSNLTLLNSSFIEVLYFHGNSSISLINSSMNYTVLNEGVIASLSGSSINNLSASENCTVWLQSSVVEKYELNHDTKICNITTLAVTTKLNLQPLQISVELTDLSGETLALSETDEQGKAEFTLIRDIISLNKTTMEMMFSPHIEYCFVEAKYENLQQKEGVDIVGDYVEVGLEFEDYNAPVINDVRFKIDPFLNTHEKVLVSVHVEDEETNLANVTLVYSTDDGTTWEKITMYNTGQNMYENSIPGQSDGTKVRFYIVAEDKCGNTAESEYYAYTVGEGVVLINNMIVITALVLVFAALIWVIIKVLWDKKKLGKYIHRDE